MDSAKIAPSRWNLAIGKCCFTEGYRNSKPELGDSYQFSLLEIDFTPDYHYDIAQRDPWKSVAVISIVVMAVGMSRQKGVENYSILFWRQLAKFAQDSEDLVKLRLILAIS